MNPIMANIGCIDEKGYLKGFRRRGYTPAKCVLELVANCLDSYDYMINNCDSDNVHTLSPQKIIAFTVTPETISFIDSAGGMDVQGATNMFAIHRENHAGDVDCRGVSGAGAKASCSILSEEKEMHIKTRKLNGDYLCIIVPWDKIHRTGVYSGMVQIRPMTLEEISRFKQERMQYGMVYQKNVHGTTLEFPSNSILKSTLEDNFINAGFKPRDPTDMSRETELKNPMDRIDTVFGRELNTMFIYHSDPEPAKVLSLYNYFEEPNEEYYTGKSHDTIEHWYSEREKMDRFLWRKGDIIYEVPVIAKGFARDAKETKKGLSGFTRVGEFEVIVGLRKDITIFDDDNPTELTATEHIGHYNVNYLGESCSSIVQNYMSCFKLVRSKQTIGLVPTPDVAFSSARANGPAYYEYRLVQCEIQFTPFCSQDNHEDRITNIQENKNQFDGESLPKNFTRLVKAIKKEKTNKILAHFANRLDEPRRLRAEQEERDRVARAEQEERDRVARAEQEEHNAEQEEHNAEQEEHNAEQEEHNAEQEEQPTTQPQIVRVITPPIISIPPEPVQIEEQPAMYNVISHRRGAVKGTELFERISLFDSLIDANATYTHATVIELYNTLYRVLQVLNNECDT